MEQRAQRFGRKIRYGMNPFVAIGETEEEAIESTLQSIFNAEATPDVRKIKLRMMPATKAGLMGPAKMVRAQMRRFEDMGLELILCKMIPTPPNISRIGNEILDYCH